VTEKQEGKLEANTPPAVEDLAAGLGNEIDD